MTWLQLVVAARERFIRAGVPPDQAAIDAEVLLRHVTGWDRASYLARRLEPATEAHRYEAVIVRRERREPVAYITGHREFWGLDFTVTPAVLIPRPETELIVEAALERLTDADRTWRIVDVGTGSGCMAIAIAKERPRALVTATDVSAAALAIARENAARLGVADRIAFVETPLLTGLDGPFDLLVSNLPYVPRGARPALSPDVRDYEPETALYGDGADGLGTVRTLLASAGPHLAPGGWLLMEFGMDQGAAIVTAARDVSGLEVIEVLRDLQGHQRTLVARGR